MVKKMRRIPFALILSLCMLASFLGTTAYHAKASEAEGNNTKRIYDEAGLLTQEEYDNLEDMCLEYGEEAGVEIFILTHNDPDSVYPEAYIENFEDKLPVGDRVYFLYDLTRGDNGEIFMEGYGKAETYIHSKRIDVIFDNMADDILNGYYYDAFETYITMSAAYMKDDSELNYDHDYSYDSIPQTDGDSNSYTKNQENYDYGRYYDEPKTSGDSILTNIWFQIIVSLAVGGIVVGIMAYHSGGRMTVRGNDYMDASHSGLIGRRDDYISTRVTRIRKPTQNNTIGRGGFNAGGFRGGMSMGGRSHSSGGRRL